MTGHWWAYVLAGVAGGFVDSVATWARRQCWSHHRHRRRDTGEPIRIRCQLRHNHEGLHAWYSTRWSS